MVLQWCGVLCCVVVWLCVCCHLLCCRGVWSVLLLELFMDAFPRKPGAFLDAFPRCSDTFVPFSSVALFLSFSDALTERRGVRKWKRKRSKNKLRNKKRKWKSENENWIKWRLSSFPVPFAPVYLEMSIILLYYRNTRGIKNKLWNN